MARIRLVAAEVPGVDGRLELAAEALVLGGDPADDALHRARDVHPRALGVRGGAPGAPPPPHPAPQLPRGENPPPPGARRPPRGGVLPRPPPLLPPGPHAPAGPPPRPP